MCGAMRMRCADLSKNYFAKITYGTYTLLALMPPNAFFEYVRGEVRTKYVEETPFRVFDGRTATLQTASSLWRISYENGRIVVKNEELNIQE